MKDETKRQIPEGGMLRFRTKEDAIKQTELRKANKVERWILPKLLGIGSVECNSILLKGNEPHKLKCTVYGFSAETEPIDMEDPDNIDCVRTGTGLFLVYPNKNMFDLVSYPISKGCYADLLERCGDTCPVMRRFNEKVTMGPDGDLEKQVKPNDKWDALPLAKRAARLDEDISLCKKDNLVVIYDGKVRAIKSNEYVPIDTYDLLLTTLRVLEKEFPQYAFIDGAMSHDTTWCEFDLCAGEFERTIRATLTAAKYNVGSVKVGARFSTSETGNGSVVLLVFAKIDGIVMPLSEARMKHVGECSLEKFNEMLGTIADMVSDGDAAIEMLAGLPLKHPAKVLEAVCRGPAKSALKIKDAEKFSAAVCTKMAENTGGGTGIDVYLGYLDIVQRIRDNVNPAPSAYLRMTEFIFAQFFNIDLEALDRKVIV